MNGAAIVQGKNRNVVSVFFTCVSCGKVEEKKVFRARELPKKVYWECLGCQRLEKRRERGPKPEFLIESRNGEKTVNGYRAS